MGNNTSSQPRSISLDKERTSSQKGAIKSLSRNLSVVPIPSSNSSGDVISNNSSFKQRFRWENGRRFHAVEGSTYGLPNDERETDRLTRLHFLLRWSMDGLFKAPVAKIIPEGKVLDIGCGPGTWLLDMAHEYTTAELHGVDISAVYPELIHPANVHFQFGNILERLPFEDETFDYVHQSLLVAGIPEHVWSRAMAELVRVTKKGGWIEIVEMDLIPKSMGPMQSKTIEKLHLALRARGADVGVARRLGRLQSQAGLIEVCTNYVSIPCNWGQSNLGEMMRDNIEELLWSVEPMLSKTLGIFDKENYERDVIRPFTTEAAECKSYYNYHYSYGQVPE